MFYRVHITCPAKHTTYQDYKTRKSAIKNFIAMNDLSTWYASHVEKIKCDFNIGLFRHMNKTGTIILDRR
jgi:hypothetical protein